MSSSDDMTARDRIRDAALERFGRDGINRVTVRAIAAQAGVSPALVVHHFGSKEALRQECDAYVAAIIRGHADAGRPGTAGDGSTEADAGHLVAALEAGAPIRRYLARAFLDGSEQAAGLFDEIVDAVGSWLDQGEQEGWVRPTSRPRARTVLYVSWLLAPLVLDQHIARALGATDPHDAEDTLRFAPVMVEMLTHGVFAGPPPFPTWDAIGRTDATDQSEDEHGPPDGERGVDHE